MSSCKLLCPSCSGHFDFQIGAGPLPEALVCPKCGENRSFPDYAALMKCPHCGVHLEVPLEMLPEKELYCPRCNRAFSVWAAQNSSEDFEISAEALYRVGGGKKTMLQENSIFDKYRVLKLLGKGGMSEVYLAEHIFLKQKCALKIMKQSAFRDDLIGIKRFVREAKISHALDHPNITRVYDVGSNSRTGLLYIAMEYVEGKTLQELCRGKLFSEDELIRTGIEMSRALIELEKHQVVHRDIKPSNIMLAGDGTLKLMDLGIAKSESGEAGEMTLTMEQTAIGTPGYASPEQCRSARSVDARSDIYCLGATLYHLASGKIPFSGDTLMNTILKVMMEEPEPLEKLRPDLSRHIVGLIGKMMKKDPAQRPQNAEQLLGLFQTGKTSAELSSRLGKKKKILISACILLLLAAAALAFFYPGPQKRRGPRIERLPLPVLPSPQTASAVPAEQPVSRNTAPPQSGSDETAHWLPGPGTQWHIRLDTAMKAAQKEHKKICVVLTVSDSDSSRQKLYADFFAGPEFLHFAEKNLILLYLDQPLFRPMPEIQKSYNRALRSILCGSTAAPYTVILDEKGLLHGKIGAYGNLSRHMAFLKNMQKSQKGRYAPIPPEWMLKSPSQLTPLLEKRLNEKQKAAEQVRKILEEKKKDFSFQVVAWGLNKKEINRPFDPRREIRVPVRNWVYFKVKYSLPQDIRAIAFLRMPQYSAASTGTSISGQGTIIGGLTCRTPCRQKKILIRMRLLEEESSVVELPCLVTWEQAEPVPR